MQRGSKVTIEGVRPANISIIIPSCVRPHFCLPVLRAVERQGIEAQEIIIVDSSGASDTDWVGIKGKLGQAFSDRLKVHHVRAALPGKARNQGIKLASGDWIAFLDVNTLPGIGWLENSLRSTMTSGALGSWGSTAFQADTKFAELLRDGIYGVDPKRTLPGSLFHKSVMEAVGHFIEWVRAGEDTEWMTRALTLGISIIDGPRSSIRYSGMARIGPGNAIRKWHRNYIAAHMLHHLHYQKIIAWLILYAIFVTAAFNWNAIVAGWQTDSPLYIDHITKLSSLAPLWIYILLRGAWLPHQRGVPWKRLLPLRFLLIASVCLILDIVKALVFFVGRRHVNPQHDTVD
jgi:GT2 family glycosyltransferase